MKFSQATKSSTSLILPPTLRIRTRYAALMMLGIGIMLFAIAGSVNKGEAAAVGGWAAFFLLFSVLLLGVIGIAAVWGQLFRAAARDVKNAVVGEGNKNTPETSSNSDDKQLSDTERALIKLLRNNDIPPDIVAESIREVMERRMGR